MALVTTDRLYQLGLFAPSSAQSINLFQLLPIPGQKGTLNGK
jgi:hypothetical protein